MWKPAGTSQAPDPAVIAAEALRQRFQEARQAAAQEGSRVTTGPHSVEIRARLENQGEQDSRHIAGVAFAVAIDGTPAPPLTAGAVETGGSAAEAVQGCAESWSRLVGTALVRAFAAPTAGRERSPVPYQLFPGATALRGDVDATMFQELEKALSQALDPFARRLTAGPGTGAYHSITLLVVVDGRGTVDGQCRLDGKESPELLAVLRQLAWPSGQPSYMFKRFYVVRAR